MNIIRRSYNNKKSSFDRFIAAAVSVILLCSLTLGGCGMTAYDGNSETVSSESCAASSAVSSSLTTSVSSSGRSETGSDATEAENISCDGNDVTVSAGETNSWEDGKASYGQFALNISNKSGNDISDWKADIKVPEGTEISQSWNCKADIKGKDLTLTGVDYNSCITDGSSYSDVGFILSCKDDIPDISDGSFFLYTVNGKAVKCSIAGSDAEENGIVTAHESESSTDTVTTDTEKDKSSSEKSDKGAVKSMDKDFRVTQLHVDGTELKDSSGNDIQLKGISSHALALYPQYVNEKSLKTLRDEWHANVFRLAMYTMEDGGYCNGGDQKKLESTIDTAVKACVSLNMYVIIDWHILSDGNPMTHEKEAETFFEKMSEKYAGIPNVIYEICNEPNGSDWKTQIKPYAEDIIPIIRKNDSKALIIVGTNTWSQDVTDVAADPLKYDNIMYALHFYAGTHKEDLRLKLVKALKAGTPVFISECSICDASGNGGADTDSGNEWMDLIYKYGLSYIEWSLTNKDESSAILKPSCTKTYGYTDSDLTEIGKWYKDVMSTR